MTRYLITGAHGFIGRRLTEMLRERDADVVAAGREFDLMSPERADALFRDSGRADCVIHLADVQGDARWSAAHAATQFMANAHIAINVLDAWIRYQPAARLVGMSTLWAYPEKIAAAREDSYWDGRMHQPTEHYGIVKKLLGVGIQAARREHGLRGTMLVLGNVYGPNDSSHHVIPSLIRRMRENPARLEIQGDGSQTRDFIYVDDQVESIIQHLNCDRELLNIGSGTTTSIRELVAVLARALPYHGEIVFKSEAGFGVDQRRIDVSRATEETGWPASYQVHTLDEGIAKTVATLN